MNTISVFRVYIAALLIIQLNLIFSHATGLTGLKRQSKLPRPSSRIVDSDPQHLGHDSGLSHTTHFQRVSYRRKTCLRLKGGEAHLTCIIHDVGESECTLAWTRMPDATKYEIQWQNSSSGDFTSLSSEITGTMLRKKNLQPSTRSPFPPPAEGGREGRTDGRTDGRTEG